ncbi:MAG: hypothetical protein IIC20_06615, partial [Chloroflexi bacterium]|nr:hypothetical protein [Chloroflexota bacterium]
MTPSNFTPGANRNKASVTVDLAGQPRLSADQVMSITNMVSASYPQLAPEDVFVADTSGHPYRYRGDAQTLSDRLDVRRRLEAATEEKASRTLADYDAICSATIDVRVFDEVKSTDLNYQPDGQEPITAYREDSKEDETTTRPRGTAGLRAESQNSNRTASGGGRTTGTRKRVESLERNLVDERFKSELEKMKLVINAQGSSLAISLPESLAEAGAEQDPLRTKGRNLAAKATGLLEVNIAVEFTPRRAPEAQVGFF